VDKGAVGRIGRGLALKGPPGKPFDPRRVPNLRLSLEVRICGLWALLTPFVPIPVVRTAA